MSIFACLNIIWGAHGEEELAASLKIAQFNSLLQMPFCWLPLFTCFKAFGDDSLEERPAPESPWLSNVVAYS